MKRPGQTNGIRGQGMIKMTPVEDGWNIAVYDDIGNLKLQSRSMSGTQRSSDALRSFVSEQGDKMDKVLTRR